MLIAVVKHFAFTFKTSDLNLVQADKKILKPYFFPQIYQSVCLL